ncbi:DeoR/GlpR transcriptional regulator [Streptomyces sp. A7024]|uniref:DeoR/GlpR transcriptional regulator n=1 Tax=Streptomyces coryli TaxID=1128680 RepID=A0A6G4U6Q6_9ACTN|nr:DeoR/GlpR transcriptional regulator [Streptomyces coryli]
MGQPAARRGTRERHEALLKLLREGTTQVEELAAALAVSPSTVRRDLGRLTEDRKVARTYGGAVVPEAFHERPVGESALMRRQAKEAIADAALGLVPDTGAIFVDAGTTCAALARRLAAADAGRSMVVTRGLETALALSESPDIDVVMLGGSVRRLSHGLVGPLADLALERLSFATAFLGADAVDPRRGVGEPTLEETAVKERVAARAERVVVLADALKLSVPQAPSWARLPAGWTLVTDGDAPADLTDACAAAGVALIRA